ncbi:MAG: methyltransferase domain-containing protein, partial [Actinomycetota bacterium]|nr:methyltransferase domain-containing protein [Actinomycetota bacterium]
LDPLPVGRSLRVRDERGRETFGFRGRAGSPAGEAYSAFEDVFRGTEELIEARQRVYVELVAGREPVLDVGCGRGEFLDLLREAGVRARGVDVDEGMAARARAKGHDVEQADAVDYLERQPDGSFGAIFSAQVIEHLPYARLMRFLELCREKLVPGGLLVAETVNPHSVVAFRNFWRDPTHETPVYPEVAVALCRIHGFESAFVQFPRGTGDLDRDLREQDDYAVVATTAS